MGATVITYTSPIRRISRHLVKRAGTVTLSSSYATGGDDFNPIVGKDILNMSLEEIGGFTAEFDKTNKKLKVSVPGVAIAAAGAATIDDFALTGTGASTARSIGLDSAATSPVRFGPQQEVAATTNLTTLTVRWEALGKK